MIGDHVIDVISYTIRHIRPQTALDFAQKDRLIGSFSFFLIARMSARQDNHQNIKLLTCDTPDKGPNEILYVLASCIPNDTD